jgi:hypothetical protein
MLNKKIGRPAKCRLPGTRVSLGLKVTPRMKSIIDDAAKKNGITQSQEAEKRLEFCELVLRLIDFDEKSKA